MPRNQQVIGMAILAAGLFILLGKIGVFAFIGGTMWPLLMFLIGIAFYVLTRIGLLPPVMMVLAGMLTMYGVLFMLSHWVHWRLFGLLWPLLLIGIGIGLYGYYAYDPYHPRGAWQGALLFCGIGAVMLLLTLVFAISTFIVAFTLIVVGAGLVFGGVHRRSR